MKETAVEFLEEKFNRLNGQLIDLDFQQAKEMEKQQMDKVAGDWWNEGASYMYDGKRKYETFEQYYNETFKQQ
jgi:hypothetical protein